ncbi:nuclear transport factor 2 family protein [Novosphingobium sp. M1R2S20]|uniref:Nuclear transport factor 2 family protein n=1 Tax=Novosphingobium rhizovicinum TaxID=3228928 RepID=A0ABV3R9R5_9SPHN
MDLDDNRRLQELWDHHQIRQTLAMYCHGCDRADIAEMASVYCEESWDDHGPNKCDGRMFAKVILEQARQTTRVVSHQLGQSLIRVFGTGAAAETYFVATLISDSDEGERMTQLGGRYVDTLAREDGGWKIKERLCVRDWSSTGLIDPGYLAKSGFIEGSRGGADVSWDRLRLVPETA